MKEAKCIFLRGKIVDSRAIQLESRRRMKEENKTSQVVIFPIENYMNDHDNASDCDPNDTPFDANAIATTRAIEGSVRYDLYAVGKCSNLPQSKSLVPIDITP